MLRQAGVGQLNLKLWVPTASQSYNPSPLKTAELIQADLGGGHQRHHRAGRGPLPWRRA